ncbi:MAG: putative phosphotransferase, partial [uncultured Acidimicrobiales bacterium]
GRDLGARRHGGCGRAARVVRAGAPPAVAGRCSAQRGARRTVALEGRSDPSAGPRARRGGGAERRRGARRVGRRARWSPVDWRPSLVARRPAPGQRARGRRCTHGGDRLRRHHRRRPCHRPGRRLDDVRCRGAVVLPGGRRPWVRRRHVGAREGLGPVHGAGAAGGLGGQPDRRRHRSAHPRRRPRRRV